MAIYEVKVGVGIIPEGTTVIERSAFMCCTRLTSIVIPDTVTKIENYAFAGCTGLTSIVIPDSVTEIGIEAFDGCTGVTSLVIGSSLRCFDMSSFGFFKKYKDLGSIVVSEGNTICDSRNGCNGIISTRKNTLLVGGKNTVIPDSVTEIEMDAFSGRTGLTSLIIPNSVTKIRTNAFAGCTGLTSIVIPDSVKEIEYEAFKGCTGLTSIIIPDTSTAIIGKEAFSGCTSLTSITIPKSVELDRFVFEGCTGLKSASLFAKYIGEGCFEGCTSLETVTVGVGINDLQLVFGVYGRRPALKTINVPSKKTEYYKNRLPEELHGLIVELPAEKKAKKK